jgi:hypothetical protein
MSVESRRKERHKSIIFLVVCGAVLVVANMVHHFTQSEGLIILAALGFSYPHDAIKANTTAIEDVQKSIEDLQEDLQERLS